jgi:hypothetical protein
MGRTWRYKLLVMAEDTTETQKPSAVCHIKLHPQCALKSAKDMHGCYCTQAFSEFCNNKCDQDASDISRGFDCAGAHLLTKSQEVEYRRCILSQLNWVMEHKVEWTKLLQAETVQEIVPLLADVIPIVAEMYLMQVCFLSLAAYDDCG